MGEKWYAMSIRDVVEKLKTDPVNGLSEEEAKRRLKEYGPNVIEARGKRSFIKILLGQILNLFMLLLLIAALIAFYVGETEDSISILAIMAIMVAAGVIQEYRAEKALEKLKSMIVPKARVLRDGRVVEVDSRCLVPGDILVLSEGDRVSADARLIESSNLYVDESLLTGESRPVAKRADAVLEPDVPVADRVNMVFSGTYVVRGSGKAVVVATGLRTEVGRIAQMIAEASGLEEKTTLHKEMDKLAKQLGAIIIAIALLVLGLSIALKVTSIEEALLTSIALAVAAVPEGLPAVLTMILALSVVRMARRHALVRRLGAVQTLGRVTVIATDKTGTLTRNEMAVVKIWLPTIGYMDVSGSGYLREGEIKAGKKIFRYGMDNALDLLIEDAVLCNNSSVDYSSNPPKPIGDPLESALIVLAVKAGVDPDQLRNRFERVKEVPFTSERKMMSVVVRGERGYIVFTKGAPEVVLSRSQYIVGDSGAKELTGEDRDKINRVATEMASKGLRVLGYAYKVVENVPGDEDAENELIFIGLTGLLDPPRPEVPEAIKKAIEAGIRVVMVTGDHAVTARAIAEMIGLPIEGKKVVTGRELEKMSDEELYEIVEDVAIFARVSPEHKLRIVKALKRRGHVVAVTGDGVNDAPALKLADVGVAMGLRGTDVAREASDLILEDDNFATIVAAIEDGRTSYENIRKSTLYLLSANIAEVAIVLGSIALFHEILLTPAMILWINLVTDSLPAITLGLEPPEPDILKRSPWSVKPLLGGSGIVFITYIGLVLAIISWLISHSFMLSATTAATATFLAISVGELAHSFNMRSPYKSLLEIGLFRNRYHVIAYLVGLALSVIPIYAVPWLLGAEPLNLLLLIYILVLAHTIVLVEEVRKRITSRIP